MRAQAGKLQMKSRSQKFP